MCFRPLTVGRGVERCSHCAGARDGAAVRSTAVGELEKGAGGDRRGCWNASAVAGCDIDECGLEAEFHAAYRTVNGGDGDDVAAGGKIGD